MTTVGSTHTRPGDRIFRGLSTSAATLITVLITAIGVFLVWRAVPALRRNEGGLWGFFSYAGPWETQNTQAMHFGIPNLLAVTVLISVVALALAMPVALGIAIFLSHYAPARLVRPLGYLVDMLAAVPSIVYGLWGWLVLGPWLSGLYEWLARWAGGFFLFTQYDNSPAFATGRNLFTGGIVLAVMILPIIAATAREVFVQTPKGQVEAALALGETMALYMVISPAAGFRFSLFDGGTTFATAIANAAPEFNNNISAGAYIAAGLVLFVLTFVVNSIARALVAKK